MNMKSIKLIKKDILAASVFVFFGLLLILLLIPRGVVEPGNVELAILSPSYYPKIVSYILILIGLGIFIKNFPNGFFEESEKIEKKYLFRILIIFITILTIVFFLPTFGIPLTSGIALLFLLMLGGERRPIIIFLVSTLVPLLIYLFFTKVAQIPIPNGLLESLL
jgi:putative tricarboxylic transport membrane protein|tara:strand:+ start:959 stop:1453 length:495 start_codon:yes stop_codon:yes gene_type:complete